MLQLAKPICGFQGPAYPVPQSWSVTWRPQEIEVTMYHLNNFGLPFSKCQQSIFFPPMWQNFGGGKVASRPSPLCYLLVLDLNNVFMDYMACTLELYMAWRSIYLLASLSSPVNFHLLWVNRIHIFTIAYLFLQHCCSLCWFWFVHSKLQGFLQAHEQELQVCTQ